MFSPGPGTRLVARLASRQSPYSASKVSGGIGTGNSDDSIFGGGSSGGGGTGGSFSEQEARGKLGQTGIAINKNPCPQGVRYQSVPGGCTSFDGIKASTLEEIIQLKNTCNCPIEITGGTELGHAQNEVSHANGDKVDLGLNSKLDNYIEKNFKPIRAVYINGLPYARYQAPNGTLYVREGNHWDVKVVR